MTDTNNNGSVWQKLPLTLFFRHLHVFLLPETMHPFEVHMQARQHCCIRIVINVEMSMCTISQEPVIKLHTVTIYVIKTLS